ncbi:hypothetical protein TNCT_357001 [Trichonephila clavata]|uniref:Uncharacterized protein n=1 Tax=Trichonephila clavata TaxID=2740835 RepID=A0A8X6LVY6_TRICU|nr:hypothetical protein TNCT_357001 [Trichonephila clavata]
MDVNQSSKCYLGSAHSVIDDNRNFRFSDVIANMADVVITIHTFHRWISIYQFIQASMTSGMHLHFQARRIKWKRQQNQSNLMTELHLNVER